MGGHGDRRKLTTGPSGQESALSLIMLLMLVISKTTQASTRVPSSTTAYRRVPACQSKLRDFPVLLCCA